MRGLADPQADYEPDGPAPCDGLFDDLPRSEAFMIESDATIVFRLNLAYLLGD